MEDNSIFEKESRWEPESEIRKIQKSIRRRNWKNIAISVVLASALLVVSVFGIIPWVESLYWNPDEMTYQNGTDLEITLQAYTELFAPGYKTSWVADQRTGFASYELQIHMESSAHDGVFTARGSLEKNELHLDAIFTHPEGKNYSLGRSTTGKVMTPSETEAQRQRLRELPDYFCLEAAIVFNEDLSMEEFLKLRQKLVEDSVDVTWMAVRTMELDDGWSPFCGMSFSVGRPYSLVDLDYRCFSGPASMNTESLEHHFKSLLRYSADQVEKGRGIAPYGHESVYTEILDYVEENGVMTYGIVVTASPQSLLKLMGSDRIYEIRLIDGWLDIE